MAPAASVQRVRIYLNRDDQWQGEPRYLALLEQLRRSGASGATALQGLAGFGPGQRSRPGLPERSDRNQPVVIEWIDRAERVGRLLPLLDELIADALVTVEEIPLYRATLRARGAFTPDRSVGDLMRAPAPAVAPGAALTEALALMAAEGLAALPVADTSGRLAGLITPETLTYRAGLRLPVALLTALNADEGAALLAALSGRNVSEVMSVEPRAVPATAAIPQAVITMIEWGYPAVPVVDRAGLLVGLLGHDEVLRAAVEQAASTDEAVRDAEPPAQLRLVMQTAPTIPADLPLDQALAQLLATPERRLLLLDEGRLVGVLDARSALKALVDQERAALIAALQRSGPPFSLPGAGRSAAAVAAAPPPALAPDTTLFAAAHRLLELRAEWLPVAADDGALFGIIARGGLVRALMQQSD